MGGKVPSEKAHADKTVHNVAFVCFLDGHPRFHDWTATGAFYAAVHAAEALFAARPQSPRHGANHEEREYLLKTERRYGKIWRHYRPLHQAATVARYLKNVETFAEFLPPREVRSTLLKHHLASLLTSARRFVGSEARTAFNEAVALIKCLPAD